MFAASGVPSGCDDAMMNDCLYDALTLLYLRYVAFAGLEPNGKSLDMWRQ